jgi:dephospho-CoA kinase
MKRPFVLGLTGSIGMGKSTTAAMFDQAGIPVWDADAAVHRLYRPGGAAVEPLAELRPEAIGPDGVDRTELKAWIARNPSALRLIEQIVHPLLAKDRAEFIARAQARGEDMVVLDMPLLFETGAEDQVDAILVITAPAEVQRARVLAREGVTAEQFESLHARQVPDAEKRRRADFVIETRSLDQTREEVTNLIRKIRRRHHA